MQKWCGRFPAFSFSSQSSDESCTSLVIWGSAQTNICTPFSIHSSIQHTTWNQGKGFSPILPSKNGKKDSMKTSLQGSKRKNLLDFIMFCSDLQSSVAAVILLSKVKWRQPLPPDNLWFYLSQQVGSMCSGERVESFEPPSEKRTGRTKTPPFDTSELLQQCSEFGRWWPYIPAASYPKKLCFSLYLILATVGKEQTSNSWRPCLLC